MNWFARYQRAAGSPSKIEELYAQIFKLDSRHALPLIGAPTLVITTEGPLIPAEHSRFIADHVAGDGALATFERSIRANPRAQSRNVQSTETPPDTTAAHESWPCRDMRPA